jgi:pyrroloquinoline quinone biosynthesis protein B
MRRRAFLTAWVGSAASALLSAEKRWSVSIQPKKGKEKGDVVLKVLGTAQDGGIPHFGCYCEKCTRAWREPSLARLISSLAILDLKEEKYFLLDATPDIRVQNHMALERLNLKNAGIKRVPDGVLLTHAHIGHYTGLVFFGYEAISTYRLPLYCSSRMRDFLVNNGPWSQLVSLENIAIHNLSYDKIVALTPRISVTGFQVPHRDEYTDTLGFVISGPKKSLLYIPDIEGWEAWDRSIVKEVEKVNIALLDGTFYSPQELPGRDLSRIGHPFIEDSLDTLEVEASRGRARIYFTHLNHTNLAFDPEGEARKQVEKRGFAIASDGMEFAL